MQQHVPLQTRSCRELLPADVTSRNIFQLCVLGPSVRRQTGFIFKHPTTMFTHHRIDNLPGRLKVRVHSMLALLVDLFGVRATKPQRTHVALVRSLGFVVTTQMNVERNHLRKVNPTLFTVKILLRSVLLRQMGHQLVGVGEDSNTNVALSTPDRLQ